MEEGEYPGLRWLNLVILARDDPIKVVLRFETFLLDLKQPRTLQTEAFLSELVTKKCDDKSGC